ncbi:MAG: EAL domain-containing protein [Thiobacillus sp.]|nr:EAL domain-containing protein [Thiobacillus sp.]
MRVRKAAPPFSRLLRNALLTLFMVGTAALFAYGVYAWQREERDVREHLLTLSGFLASASQAFFDELGNGLAPMGNLVDRPELRSDPESLRGFLLEFQARHPQVRAVAVFAPDGEMLLNTAIEPGAKLPDFRSDPPYIKQLLADMASPAAYTVGPPEFGKAIKLWRFTIRHVVRGRDGRPRLLVQAAIPLERDHTFLYQLPVPANSYIGLLRADGFQQARFPMNEARVIYGRRSPGPAARTIRDNPGIQQAYFAGSSSWVTGERERVGAFTKLEKADMYAYISVPETYVLSRWSRHNAPVFISFAVFFGVFVVIAHRVTRRERLHSYELIEQAERDALTGLPNRGCLNGVLESTIAIAQSTGNPFSILFLDLDRFKGINDTLGHAIGDRLLKQVSERVQPLLRHGDVLGRFGGDEFLLILPGANETGAILTTRRIMDAFHPAFEVDGRALRVTPSIGIAIYPDHGLDVEALLKHADTAMYESKRLGRNAYTVYAEQMGARVRERLEMEHELRDALQNDAFRLVYQPIVDMRSGEVVAVETLVRWMMPDGTMRPPCDFIQTAEDSGLIIPLGQWVLRTACLQLRQWLSSGLDLRMCVNLSTHQFQDPHLVEKVMDTLNETGVRADRLELEITESAAMLNPEESMKILGELVARGVRIAIDDFGTGYSSLSYLKRIPADTIKIDKSFVDGLGHEQDATIVRAVIALARALEKDTIAEGIESESQFYALQAMGCDYAQGYWVSRPITEEALTALLAETPRLVAVSNRARDGVTTWLHAHGKSAE